MQVLKTYDNIATLRAAGWRPAALLDLAEQRMADVIRVFREDADTEWTADEFGAFVLLEQGDDVRDLGAAGLSPENDGLLGACWEVCHRHPAAEAFDVLVLFSNDGGTTFLVPDAPWLDPELRAKLEAEACAPWWQQSPAATAAEVPF